MDTKQKNFKQPSFALRIISVVFFALYDIDIIINLLDRPLYLDDVWIVWTVFGWFVPSVLSLAHYAFLIAFLTSPNSKHRHLFFSTAIWIWIAGVLCENFIHFVYYDYYSPNIVWQLLLSIISILLALWSLICYRHGIFPIEFLFCVILASFPISYELINVIYESIGLILMCIGMMLCYTEGTAKSPFLFNDLLRKRRLKNFKHLPPKERLYAIERAMNQGYIDSTDYDLIRKSALDDI